MLSLYEWGMCRGVKAWLYVGVATRLAQAAGLAVEQDLDDEPLALGSTMQVEKKHFGLKTTERRSSKDTMTSTGDMVIDREIRRRTFWSCFILDRYLSSGKYRPQMINVPDLRVQLPSSKESFLFGTEVRTRLLGEEIDDALGRGTIHSSRRLSFTVSGSAAENSTRSTPRESIPDTPHQSYRSSRDVAMDDEDRDRWETGDRESLISKVVKIVEIWGRIAKWSCAGGRRTEKFPPWDDRSTFCQLRSLLRSFRESLPRHLTYTPTNIKAHIQQKTSTSYTLMHVIHFLGVIVINRDYVPFIPIRCKKPEGPLDPPIFSPDEYIVPENFWVNSARDMTKNARDMMDLLRVCQEWGVLVETPMIGFALYTVAFVGTYCMNFTAMDPEGWISAGKPGRNGAASPKPQGDGISRSGEQAARRAVEMIGLMRPRLKMADGWFRTLMRVHSYYGKLKEDWRRNTNSGSSSSDISSPDAPRHISVREGGPGGGLPEYKLFEKALRDFGTLDESDVVDMDDDPAFGRNTDTPMSESGSVAPVKSERELENMERSSSVGTSFNPINNLVAAAATQEQRDQIQQGIGEYQSSRQSPAYNPFVGSAQPPQQSGYYMPNQPPLRSPNQAFPPPFSPSQRSGTGNLPSPFISSGGQPTPSDESNGYSGVYSRPGTSSQEGNNAGGPMYSPSSRVAMQPPGPPGASGMVSPSLPNQSQSYPQGWNTEQQRREYIANLPHDMGMRGEDVAAFVDGSSWETWGGDGANVGGWLQTLHYTTMPGGPGGFSG
jgi:Fungal specific transcription factor domain